MLSASAGTHVAPAVVNLGAVFFVWRIRDDFAVSFYQKSNAIVMDDRKKM